MLTWKQANKIIIPRMPECAWYYRVVLRNSQFATRARDRGSEAYCRHGKITNRQTKRCMASSESRAQLARARRGCKFCSPLRFNHNQAAVRAPAPRVHQLCNKGAHRTRENYRKAIVVRNSMLPVTAEAVLVNNCACEPALIIKLVYDGTKQWTLLYVPLVL